jgi:hypothetical protein
MRAGDTYPCIVRGRLTWLTGGSGNLLMPLGRLYTTTHSEGSPMRDEDDEEDQFARFVRNQSGELQRTA